MGNKVHVKDLKPETRIPDVECVSWLVKWVACLCGVRTIKELSLHIKEDIARHWLCNNNCVWQMTNMLNAAGLDWK